MSDFAGGASGFPMTFEGGRYTGEVGAMDSTYDLPWKWVVVLMFASSSNTPDRFDISNIVNHHPLQRPCLLGIEESVHNRPLSTSKVNLNEETRKTVKIT